MLKRCLDALIHQNFASNSYEVIVVDDAACKETQALVEDVQAEKELPLLRYIPLPEYSGPAAARNAGWRAAQGDIIAFTDDDTIPDVDWLAAGATVLMDNSIRIEEPVQAVTGKIRVPLPDKPTDYELNVAGLQNAEFATANCFFRRDVLDLIGGFDENFKMAFREDSDLFFTLLEHGGRVLYLPTAQVVHPIRPGQWGISLKQQAKGTFDALLYKKHPELFRRSIKPGTPWWYYGMLGALFAASVAFIAGRRKLALGGLIAWVGLTGNFAVKRLTSTSRAPGHIAEMLITSALIPPVAIFWRILGAIRYRVLFF